jgi:hypothetical protein
MAFYPVWLLKRDETDMALMDELRLLFGTWSKLGLN